MLQLIKEHEQSIIYFFIIVSVVILLLLITNTLYKWQVKKANLEFPNEEHVTLHLLKSILKVIWIILGLSASSFVFISKDLYGQAAQNFWLLVYLGSVVLLTVIGGSVVQTLFTRKIQSSKITGTDPTSYKFIRSLAVIVIYFFGGILAILAFPSLRGTAHTALGGAGVIAIIAGVASQEALSNVVGGVFIIIFKPFKLYDILKISDEMVGVVTDITLRHTVIRNYENKMIVIPNSIINKEKIVNYDLGDKKCCQWIEIGISYDSDMDLAKAIMQEECEAHPSILEHRTLLEIKNKDPKVIVRVINLGDFAITLRAWAWAKDYSTSFVMKCELYESIKKRFDREGIEIPYPHRTVVFKNANDTPSTK